MGKTICGAWPLAICLAIFLSLGIQVEAPAKPGEIFGFTMDMNAEQSRGMAEILAKRMDAQVRPMPNGVAIVKGGDDLLVIRNTSNGFISAIIMKPGIFGKRSIDRETFAKFCKAHALKTPPVVEKLADGDVYKVTDTKRRISAQYKPGDKKRNEIAIMRLF